MENCQLSKSSPMSVPKSVSKILPQKYSKFMAFIHYYNQLLVDNNISNREDLDEISKLWSPMEEQITFVDSFLDSDSSKEFKKITSKKKVEELKKQKEEGKKQKKEVIKKENQKERYIVREYKNLVKEFKKNSHKRCSYNAEHGKQILEKMPHLSDLRDELREQKDEGLMAYVKENIVVDEDKIYKKKDKKPVGRPPLVRGISVPNRTKYINEILARSED
jgi:hypothetical protein